MNERIVKLFMESVDSNYIPVPIEDHIPSWTEKFALLIVRECANYINDRTRDWDADLRWIFNDGSGDMAVDVDNLLNRHFGVKE